MKNIINKQTTMLAASALALFLVQAPAAAQGTPEDDAGARTIQVKILGMSCPFCAYGVEQKLKRLEGVEDMDVDLASGIAALVLAAETDVSNEVLQRTVDEAGFEVAAIVRSFESEYEDQNPEAISTPGAGSAVP